MEYLPKDPAILVSSINMLLRDEEYDSLNSLCFAFNREPQEVKDYLLQYGYVFSESQLQFRPIGYDQDSCSACLDTDKDKESVNFYAIESAYAFFHQKQRIYQYSTLDWQKDDIEYAIEDYVSTMDEGLYSIISCGRTDFLRNHSSFAEDIISAVEKLDEMLKK